MTALAQPQPVRLPSGGVDHSVQAAERLRGLLDPRFLVEAGWDPARQVLAPPPEHPTLGYQTCGVDGCEVLVTSLIPLCNVCKRRWRSTGMELASFLAIPLVKLLIVGEFDCAVPACERPRKTTKARVCDAHDAQRERLGWPALAEFLTRDDVGPLPGFGGCRVPSCIRRAESRRFGLCTAHGGRWRGHRAKHPDADLTAWAQRQTPIPEGRLIVLRGLTPLVQAELLYGIQERSRQAFKTKLQSLRGLCGLLRTPLVASITELDITGGRWRAYRGLAATIQEVVAFAVHSPEAERHKDSWNMAVFGLRGILDFTELPQRWLRDAMKLWVAEEWPTRRGNAIVGNMREHIHAIKHLADSLRSSRADHGEVVAGLGRADIVAFTNRLAHLQAIGKLSASRRLHITRQVAKLLRDFRALGLTRPGQPLAGLPDDVTLQPGDIPPAPDSDEPGWALPAEILRQLIVALPQLERRSGREARVAVQLLMDTGRRPDEICALPWDCLERGADGKHVMIYTNFKANRLGRRLPISDATAALIREQQQHVRECFPVTPLGELALLPRGKVNPSASIRPKTAGSAARIAAGSTRSGRCGGQTAPSSTRPPWCSTPTGTASRSVMPTPAPQLTCSAS